MQQWKIGNVNITRIEELIGPLFDPARFFPDFDPEVFDQHREWLYPRQVDSASGNLIASMHSWLIETGHHKILVDTCIGNDKDRMPYRNWSRMHTPWLRNLVRTGVSPEEIDFVMCTHLHIDHVGWNTRLVDGNWVPTFPNAKYVFARTEFEFWQQARERTDNFNEVNKKTFDDSVLPIVDLAEMIDGEHELIADLVHLKPAPGHTPGSQCFKIKNTVVSGDTLFINGCGRVDLPGSNSDDMFRSMSKLASLPDDTLFLPGHNYGHVPNATIGETKTFNPYLKISDLDTWHNLMGH